MELLGQINERKIFYCNIRFDRNWFDQITFENWIAFTIADNDDKEFITNMTIRCLDKGVCYTCSTGQLALLTEDYFDEEIVWRQVQQSEKTGKPQDYENAPMTSSHKNFDEGFYFSTTNANQVINDNYIKSYTVVCIDCTNDKVHGRLLKLIEKINSGWLPSENEI